MKNTIQSDLIRGHINTIILKALFDGDRYGYDIVREIEQKSSGQYKLKEPTLYSCLRRLEIQGFIRSYWGAKSNGGRRKYFTLTEMGRELFIQNQSEWEYSRTVIDKLISDKEVDLHTYATDRDNDIPPVASAPKLANESNDAPVATTYEEPSENDMQADDTPQDDTQEDAATKYDNDSTDENIVFSDTSSIMNELFRRQTEAESDSYTAKLIAEKYVSDRSDTGFFTRQYFKDFYDSAEDTNEIPSSEMQTNENASAQAQVDDTEESRVFDPPLESSKQELNEQTETPSDTAETDSTTPKFLDYHTSAVLPDPQSALIEREYRNILGDFLNLCFIERTPHTQEERPVAPPAENAKATQTQSEEEAPVRHEPQEEPSLPLTPYTPDADVNRKLNRLTGEVREMGNNIVIRTHSGNSSKAYSNAYYYYSNKLSLVHYGVLFGIMMLEILFSAVFVGLVAKAGRSTDKWFYIAAGILAAAFPIAAFIRNITDPAKRKRVNFHLKNALIYRLIVMAQCFLIIYCLNIIAGMPLSFDKSYLSTVLLPALLCTNFPVSALLFNALFKSKRFAVEN